MLKTFVGALGLCCAAALLATPAAERGGGGRRRFGAAIGAVAALLAVSNPSSALAIVEGSAASQGEYPAQGYLKVDFDPGAGSDLGQCGATLVGSRQLLTSASCAVDPSNGNPLPVGNFSVLLGDVDVALPNTDVYGVSGVDVHSSYDATTNPASPDYDVAMLTLDRAANYEPMRVVEVGESALWAPGVNATIIGWGDTSDGGSASEDLLAANVPMISDQDCASDYPTTFNSATMVCALDASAPRSDTCAGDTGGPLLVPAGSGFALAGVISWGIGCADGVNPGVYARIGSNPLNAWVLARIPSLVEPPPVEPPDTTAPQTSKDDGPKAKIKTKKKKAKVSFGFSSNEAGSTFQCSLDGEAFAACTSPVTRKVKKGKHEFQVRARDAAGNIDQTPASFDFKVKQKKKKKRN